MRTSQQLILKRRWAWELGAPEFVTEWCALVIALALALVVAAAIANAATLALPQRTPRRTVKKIKNELDECQMWDDLTSENWSRI